MSLWDTIIFAILALGALAGWRSGLIRQAVGLAGVVIGILVGVALMDTVGGLVAPILRLSQGLAPILGFVIVFVGVQVAAVVSSNLLSSIVAVLRLSFLDRAGGGLLGVAKAAVISSLLLLVLNFGGRPGSAARSKSVLYEPIAQVVPELWGYLRGVFPELSDIAERFGGDVIDKVKE